MPGMTLTEKVFARATGRDEIHAGEIVFPSPDLVVNVDSAFPGMMAELESSGAEEVANRERTIVVADHDTPNLTGAMAQRSKRTRELCEKYGLRLFDVGRSGNSHILPVEQGLAGPGMLVFSMDTHSGNLGSVGAVAPCILYEMGTAMTTGTVWMRVPETIRVELVGELQPDVFIRDVADYVINAIGAEEGDYRAIEFSGPFTSSLSIDNRMVLCNRPIEVGAKVAVIPPDDVTLAYVRERGWGGFEPQWSDADAIFADVVSIDVSNVEPQVSIPPTPDNVHPLSTVAGTPITQALIQGCSSGTFEELEQAARVITGRQVHPDVRMFVVPMTQEVYRRAEEAGLLAEFSRAGATIMPPSCQSCYGMSTPLVDGDVCIATSPRNDPGRMGSRDATIYLAGPATVAASAITGRITSAHDAGKVSA